MSDMSGKPWERVAKKYMAHKGYMHIEPRDVIKIDGHPCWYYVYDLPDGAVLELEVAWEADPASTTGDGEWTAIVTTFQPPPAQEAS